MKEAHDSLYISSWEDFVWMTVMGMDVGRRDKTNIIKFYQKKQPQLYKYKYLVVRRSSGLHSSWCVSLTSTFCLSVSIYLAFRPTPTASEYFSSQYFLEKKNFKTLSLSHTYLYN